MFVDFSKIDKKIENLKELKKIEQEKIDNSFKEERQKISIIESELECLYEYQRCLMNYFILKSDCEQLQIKVMKMSKNGENTEELDNQIIELTNQINEEDSKLEKYAIDFFPIFNKYLNLCAKYILDEFQKNGSIPSVLKELGTKIQLTAQFLHNNSTKLYTPVKSINLCKENAINNIKTIRECILRQRDDAYDDLNIKINNISTNLYNINSALSIIDKLLIVNKQKHLVDSIKNLKEILN